MSFSTPLDQFLPPDLPNRAEAIAKTARHLELIVETNRNFNLTRILDPVEAAIKHTVDSVIPWRHFAKAATVADAGSGAGFPGIPLAITLPDVQFILLESTQKKARFIEAAVADLGLRNVTVFPVRAEEWLSEERPDLVTARAVAPLSRAIPLFQPAIQRGIRVLMYKGPDIEAEIALVPPKDRFAVKVLDRYSLPMDLGSRTLVEISKRSL